MDERDTQDTPRREERPDHLLTAAPGVKEPPQEPGNRKWVGRAIAIIVYCATAVIVLLTIYVATVNPVTHDASVGANYYAMAPEVSGRVVSLFAAESTCYKRGTLLVEIDPHDYEQKLQAAESDQQNLEAQIRDKQRDIHAGNNEARSSYDQLQNSKTDVAKADDQVGSSEADVEKSKADVDQKRATYLLSDLTVERNRPLAERQYISKQQFDQYLTERDSNEKALEQAEQSLRSSEFSATTSRRNKHESLVKVDSSDASYRRDQWSVPTLDTLIAQRPSKASEVQQARKNLERTKIYAPVNGCVTALNISKGAYAREGSGLFTLIDSDSWYITAAYRESDLRYIRPGMKATVTLMSDPHYALDGYVQSIGNAVQSSDSSSVGGTPGNPGNLPEIERSMNWVRLASRYPIRIRFTPRDASTLRVGTTANVTILH